MVSIVYSFSIVSSRHPIVRDALTVLTKLQLEPVQLEVNKLVSGKTEHYGFVKPLPFDQTCSVLVDMKLQLSFFVR